MSDDSALELLPVEVCGELQAILEAHPLPAGVPDADMNQSEVAAALGVTINTLGKWCDDESFPLVQRGGMGKPYILRLSHCFAWKAARDAEDMQRRRHNQKAVEALQASLLGVEVTDPAATLTPKQRDDLYRAEVNWNKLRRDRRQLVPLQEIVDLMESVFKIVRNGLEGLPDRLERELGLKPEEVELVKRAGDDVLTAMHDEIEAAELREREVEVITPDDRLLI